MAFEFLVFQIIVLIFSVVIHEFSHGWMANHLGDPTAKYAGRLTLNPIKHLDPLGSVIIPLFLLIAQSPILIGWAKPVPYNPYNLRDQKYGSALVGAAGPASNLIAALFFGIILRIIAFQGIAESLIPFLGLIVLINVLLAVFNLLPIPPLDGSKILFAVLPDSMNDLKVTFERYGLFVLIFFLFFLLPIIFPIIFWLSKLIMGQTAFNNFLLISGG
jgi:Zn-dependent protease